MILENLKKHLEVKQAEATEKQKSDPNPQNHEREQLLDECNHEIDLAYADLLEYRSHLARHKAEHDFELSEVENLADDAAIVTSDYKMKILAAFFWMNQKKWYGQCGTSCLGFMIMTNDPDNPGGKSVKFVLMVTDDTLQDEWEVICAKHHIYMHELPAHVTHVHFRSDGAGCFRSKLHRSIQALWVHWTGIIEETFTLTPAGAGKSGLDGTFGHFGAVLTTACDRGHSYTNMREILSASEASDGLTGTKIMGFMPDRSN